jgi:peptide deformylase
VAVRPVVRLPDHVLKARAAETPAAGDDRLLADLVDTMRVSPGCVGLAAPQIGISRRAIAVDVTGHPKTTVCHGLVVMLNPVLVERGRREVGREGCMSVPDFTANVARATEIVVSGVGPDGDDLVIETRGFEARAFQHEVDHLDGLLILDRVASLATDVFRRKVYKPPR